MSEPRERPRRWEVPWRGGPETLSLTLTRSDLLKLAYAMLELSGQESPPPVEEPPPTAETFMPLSYEVGLLRSELAKGLDRLDALEKRFNHHQHFTVPPGHPST